MLEVKGLTKRFGGNVAVKSVDYSVQQGKINAIIGPNGAGKSTFFNLITGVHEPTEGTIIYKNQEITRQPANVIAKLGVARTFQSTHLFEMSTVKDNVIVGHRLRTKSNLFDSIFRTKRLKEEEQQCIAKAEESLDFVGLSHVSDQLVTNISQEEKKRVAFALALATDPEIVFLDEPTAGVNPDETDEMANLIQKMSDKGLTICLIEHKMPMIMRLAHHIMVLNYGEKIAEGTPAEIQKNEEVIKAYLGGTVSA